ncbi:hypothetical protein H8959_013703 [Pygathrix nigripes]
MLVRLAYTATPWNRVPEAALQGPQCFVKVHPGLGQLEPPAAQLPQEEAEPGQGQEEASFPGRPSSLCQAPSQLLLVAKAAEHAAQPWQRHVVQATEAGLVSGGVQEQQPFQSEGGLLGVLQAHVAGCRTETPGRWLLGATWAGLALFQNIPHFRKGLLWLQAQARWRYFCKSQKHLDRLESSSESLVHWGQGPHIPALCVPGAACHEPLRIMCNANPGLEHVGTLALWGQREHAGPWPDSPTKPPSCPALSPT